jgi:hypothetical protein
MQGRRAASMLPREPDLLVTSLFSLIGVLGRPFSGFGNWFRDRWVEAGIPGRAHGFRRVGATIAAYNGATAHRLMAIFG